MSKLEEQLRKSREQERPDLQPPAGGWEAIQASLAATAAGVGTAAAATEAVAAGNAAVGAAGTAGSAAGASAVVGAKASIFVTSLKALLGLCVVGGLATGAWMTLGDDEPQGVEMVSESIATAPTPEQDPQVNTEAMVNRSSAEAATPTDMPANAATVPSAAGEAVDLDQRRDNNFTSSGLTQHTDNKAGSTPSGEVAPTATRTPQPEPEQPVATQGAEVVNAAESTSEAARTEGSASAAAPGAAAEPGNEPTATDADGNPAGSNDAAPESPAIPSDEILAESEEAIPATGFTEVETPVASQSNLVIPMLAARPVDFVPNLSETIFTGFESLMFFDKDNELNEDGKFRKFKRPVRPSWQLHGGLQGLTGNRFSFRGSNTILRRTDNGSGGFDITLPDGELVNASFTGAFTNSVTRTDNFMFRVGATRQTAWGGAFRGTLGYYHGSERQVQDFSQLGPDELAFDEEFNSSAATLELGFQYTFLRRHKFRPYLGVNSVFFLGSSWTNEQFVFDNQTGQRALVSQFDNSVRTSFWQGISVTAGFQYQLFPRLSAGAYLWGHGSVDNWIETPVGLEVRYLLK